MNYFQAMFSTSSDKGLMDFISIVEGKLTKGIRVELDREFEADEIIRALNQMHPNKAPGPDGMSLLFFKKYWRSISPSISSTLLKALNLGKFSKELNHTHITLIHKKRHPISMVDYRPISLCNDLYKILSKVLPNRIKPLFSHLIYESQSVIVPRR